MPAHVPATDASSALRGYRKMVRPRLTALVLDDGYHVQGEAARALTKLGHTAHTFALGTADTEQQARENLAHLLRAIAQLRPDFLFCVNYVGFDRAGWLSEVVERIALPVAVWFVDSPLFFGMGHLPPTPTMTSFFVWDRSHLAHQQRLGATRAHYLPLACEPEAFATAGEHGARRPTLPLGFVGSSLVPLAATWRGRLTEGGAAQAHEMAERLLADRHALHALVPNPAAPIDPRALAAALANCLASRRYRTDLLRALPRSMLHIFGDDGWLGEVPGASLHAQVPYGGALANVYRRCRINVNATILQMPQAVNQRVFDVPAAGGFLLTDDQAQLGELFDVDAGEAVRYRDAGELAALAAHYAQDDAARRRVVDAARARVRNEHTYVHRLRTLVAQMRRDHGRLPAGALAEARGRHKAAPAAACRLSEPAETR